MSGSELWLNGELLKSGTVLGLPFGRVQAMRKQAGNIDKEAKQGSRKLSVRATWDHEQFRFLSELMSVMDGGLLVVGVSGVDRVAGMQTRVSAVLFSRQGQLFWQEACAPQASCLDH